MNLAKTQGLDIAKIKKRINEEQKYQSQLLKMEGLKHQMEEIIDTHNQNEDCLSLLAKRVGSADSHYKLKKVPSYNQFSQK